MGNNKLFKGDRMRLTKGSIMRTPEPSGPHNGYATGVLLYRKGNKWYYSLTSPHDETGRSSQVSSGQPDVLSLTVLRKVLLTITQQERSSDEEGNIL